MHTVSWHVVVPVKGTGAAKSRLAPVVGDAREEFARALALDTLVATAQTPGVRLVVVSGDPIVAGEAAALGALVVPDPSAGLGAAVAAGIEVCLAEGGEARGEGTDESPASGVAVLLGDLPALRPRDLSEALAVCATEDSAFVPDADGTGTVLLAARRPKDLRPSFGPGSAAAHSASRPGSTSICRGCGATSTSPPTSRRCSPSASARTPRPPSRDSRSSIALVRRAPRADQSRDRPRRAVPASADPGVMVWRSRRSP